MFAEIYPALRQRAVDLLKPRGGSYEALRDAVKEWNGDELEAAAEKAAIPMPLALYPDPDGFVVDTPMGRYTGVKEMIEMSKTPGEYKYPLTPLGSWQPSWL